MNTLAARAEAVKLHQLLGADATSLPFLARLPETQLRRLRDAVSERLFAQDQALFRRLAAVAAQLPVLLVIPLCRAFGPMLSARIVGEMPAKRAAACAVHLPADFIARICVHIDPRRARDLIGRIPVRQVVSIALKLVENGDYPTAGRFVDFLSDEAIQAVLDTVPDEADLLRIAFYVDSRNRLDHLIRMLPEARRRKAVLLVLDEQSDLLDEILSLITSVGYSLKRELGDLAAAQDVAVIARIIHRVQEQGLWGDLLPVVASLSEANLRKVANLPILRDDPQVLDSLLLAADEHELWRSILPLVEMLDDTTRNAFALAATRVGPAAIKRAAHAVLVGELWEPMLDLVRRMPFDKQCEFAGVLNGFRGVDPDLDRRIAARASAHGLSPALASVGIA
ncbi:MAG TPA: hypothetical protein VN046_05540 [Stenotrophobium sp.]|jgi:hypothetical protein|nr:hypothetical protein [Stenotrophobium sp.]